MRRFRLKRFEVYADTVKLSTLMSLKFVVAKLLSQTLRKSSSFRTLRRLHELAKLSTLTTLHSVKFIHDFATTLVMHQACLMLPLYLQSFSGVNRVWPRGELRIPMLRAFPASNPLPYSKYDTQTTQILLEEYIYLLTRPSSVDICPLLYWNGHVMPAPKMRNEFVWYT